MRGDIIAKRLGIGGRGDLLVGVNARDEQAGIDITARSLLTLRRGLEYTAASYRIGCEGEQ